MGFSETSSVRANASTNYRADLDGLRAIAVVAVVLFHAFPTLFPGGFVGVDVFFVISGFLITSIIFADLERRKFSFVEFYGRRIRRIFPALCITLFVCLAFGWFTLLPEELKDLGKHAAGGAGFIANLMLWREAGYFDTSAELKPLLHLWSLGVEEQFYIFWPPVIYFAWKRKVNLFKVTVAVAAFSFLLNLLRISGNGVEAFYSPATRVWEILIGSLLAYIAVFRSSVLDKWKLPELRSLLGVLILVGSVLFLREAQYPGWRAAIPAVATLLTISAGNKAWINRKLLSFRPAVWIGLISYPLYLWHWPIIVFFRLLNGTTPPLAYRLIAILLSFVLAAMTYHLVEKSIRMQSIGSIAPKAIPAMIAVAIFGAYLFRADGRPDRVLNARVIEEYTRQYQWQAECRAEFNKNFSPKFYDDRETCLESSSASRENVDVVVLGDSHSNRLYWGLVQVDAKTKYLNLGRVTCMPFLNVDGERNGLGLQCQPTMANLINEARRSNAKTVVIQGYYARYFDGRVDTVSLDRLQDGIDLTLSTLTDAGKQVIVVFDNPTLPFDPARCRRRPFGFFDEASEQCKFPRKKHDQESAKYQEVLRSIIERHQHVRIVDPAEILCDKDFCYGAANDDLYYGDDHHLSFRGSSKVAVPIVSIVHSIESATNIPSN